MIDPAPEHKSMNENNKFLSLLLVTPNNSFILLLRLSPSGRNHNN